MRQWSWLMFFVAATKAVLLLSLSEALPLVWRNDYETISVPTPRSV